MRIHLVRLAMWFVGWLSRHKLATSTLLALFRAARWMKATKVGTVAQKRLLLTIGFAFLVCASVLLAQFPFVQIVQPPPPSVTGAGAAYSGPAGGDTIYYWVIARYPIGASAYPTGPIPAIGTRGVQNLGGGATVTVTWQAATAATGYDVLRSTTTQAPIPCSTCAIALDTALLTVTDSGAAGSPYPPGGLGVAQNATATLAVNNRDAATPYAYIQIGSTIVPLQPGLAPVSSVFGRTGAVVAAIGDYAFSQISSTLALSQIASGDKQGNGSKLQMFGGGAVATNDCAKFDAAGNVVSAGAACGSGATGQYAATIASSNPWTITGATHGLATCDLLGGAYSVAGGIRTAVGSSDFRCDEATYDITINWQGNQAGRVVLIARGGSGGGSGGSYTPGAGIDATQLSTDIIAIDQTTVAPMPLSFTTSQDFGSINNGACAAAVTVSSLSGVMAGDALVVGSNPPLNAGLFPVIKASTTSGEATLTVCNMSGSSVDPANSTYRIVKPVLSW